VLVVAPEAPELELPLQRRAFVPGDLDGAWLVLACTGVVDDEVARLCQERRIWCVRADDASLSDAWVPAVGRVEDVVVSVTAGRDPRRAVAVRDHVLASDLPLARQR
jgi:uroporphyrin-III C-methyltransferase/precorrin-2 dehydrogenase/sirohydrochlorin ferrochelatase